MARKPRPTTGPNPAEPRPLRVLIVCGAEADRERYRDFLSGGPDGGYDVAVADCGDTALAHTRMNNPDCILVDDRLADMGGVAFLVHLRDQKYGRHPAVIILADKRNEWTVAMAFKAGAEDYLVKDAVSQRLIVFAIANAVRIHRMRQSLSIAQAKIETLAVEDPLTGLYGAPRFVERIDQLFTPAQDRGEIRLIVLGLHTLREIDVSKGRAKGDEVLRAVAERLRSSLVHADTIARLGRDSFAAILEPGLAAETATADIDRLAQSMAAPITTVSMRDLGLGIGIAVFPHHGASPEQLLRRANAASVHAHATASDCHFFSPGETPEPETLATPGAAGHGHDTIRAPKPRG